MNKAKNDCFLGQHLAKKLIALGQLITTAAAATTQTTPIEVPKNRGNIIGISLKVANSTLATLDGYTFTLSANGANIVEDMPIILHSTLYPFDDRIYKTFVPDASTLDFIITQDIATSIVLYVEMFFDGKSE